MIRIPDTAKELNIRSIDPLDHPLPILDTSPTGISRRGLLRGALGILGGALVGTTAASQEAEAAGYYQLDTFALKVGGTGKKSKLHFLIVWKIKGQDKYAIEVRPTGWVNPKRKYYGYVKRLYANGSTTHIDSDGGKGEGGTRLIKSTMRKGDGKRFKLHGRTVPAGKKKPEYQRWLTVWRDKWGDEHYGG